MWTRAAQKGEPLKLRKGEESIFFCGNDKAAHDSKLSEAKCSILKASQLINTINKPRQFTAKPHNFFMIAGKEKASGETKEDVAALRWAASWEGTLLFSAPKAPLTSLMSPADMNATMTSLSSPASLLNRRNFRHCGFNIMCVFGDFKDTVMTVLKGFRLSAAQGKFSTKYSWQRCCLENRGRNKTARMWIL